MASPTQPNGADKGRTWDREIPAAARERSLRPGLPPHPVSPAPPPRASRLQQLHKEGAGGQVGTRSPALRPPSAPRTARAWSGGGGFGSAGAPQTVPVPRSPRLSLQMWQKPGASSTVTLDPQRSATPRTRRSCWRAC